MQNNNRYQNYYGLVCIVLVTFGFFSVFSTHVLNAQTELGNTTLLDLNNELRNIKQRIEELESQSEGYEEKVSELRKESLTLERELSLLDNRIAQLGVDIDTEQAKIDHTGLTIQGVDLEIAIAKKEINKKREQLGTLLNKLDRVDEEDYIHILLFNSSFAEFFDGIKYIETVQEDVLTAVNSIYEAKDILNRKRSTLEQKKEQLEVLKEGLEEKKFGLAEEENRKNTLLSSTRFSERRFQQLIQEVKKEQQQANADILALETQIRDRLQREQSFQNLGAGESFLWPINPSKGISANFHDPGYPYRYLFEHPGVDIRASQGTVIRAPKSGYVARTKDAGLGYSYIVLLHDDNITTVYGHVSGIIVREDDFVLQGQQLGLTGGAPGTPGAGNLSTGPHLHFEIRQSGIPVNPLDYLP